MGLTRFKEKIFKSPQPSKKAKQPDRKADIRPDYGVQERAEDVRKLEAAHERAMNNAIRLDNIARAAVAKGRKERAEKEKKAELESAERRRHIDDSRRRERQLNEENKRKWGGAG